MRAASFDHGTILVKCRALWGEPERVDAAYTVGLYYIVGLCNIMVIKRGLLRKGLENSKS